jgi:hypothetical protein
LGSLVVKTGGCSLLERLGAVGLKNCRLPMYRTPQHCGISQLAVGTVLYERRGTRKSIPGGRDPHRPTNNHILVGPPRLRRGSREFPCAYIVFSPVRMQYVGPCGWPADSPQFPLQFLCQRGDRPLLQKQNKSVCCGPSLLLLRLLCSSILLHFAAWGENAKAALRQSRDDRGHRSFTAKRKV